MTAATLLKGAFFRVARYSGVNWLFRHALGSRRVLVLCYHGVVADDHFDDTFLYRNTVSRSQFESQLKFLNRYFHPISPGDLMEHVQGGVPVRERSVLVTFDDGYRNNWIHAAPLLVRYRTPALFSITTGYIGRSDLLWPDEVNLRVLNWPCRTIPYPVASAAFPVVEVPPGDRARIPFADSIRAVCKVLPADSLKSYLDAIRQVPCPALEQRDRELYDFLSWDDVRSLVAAGFEIGSHTVSHPILTRIADDRLDYELTQSKAQIETETGKACRCLVYPNGQTPDFDQKVEQAAERAGYLLGFSATGFYASTRGARYALSRIGVPGQPPDVVFESRASGLHTWLKSLS